MMIMTIAAIVSISEWIELSILVKATLLLAIGQLLWNSSWAS